MIRRTDERIPGEIAEGDRALKALAAGAVFLVGVVGRCHSAGASPEPGAVRFDREVKPILTEYCYDCHGDGMHKGNVAFDELKSDQTLLQSRELWWKVLKNLRTGVMPPEKKPRPTAEERARIEKWIKADVFGVDPKNPDPGRVTLRRLNRVEYRNTIRDLMGIDFNTDVEFPPDDTGYGFDDIGDVLTLSPMLLEKYLSAAAVIVAQAVPNAPLAVAEKTIPGHTFQGKGAGPAPRPWALSYYEVASVSNTFPAEHAGHYQLAVDLMANEKYVDGVFDHNKCRLIFKVDGQPLFEKEYAREGGKSFHYQFERDWQAGEHEFTFELQPLTPDEKHVRSLTIKIDSITVRGPFDKKYWVTPQNYWRFFTRAAPPETAAARREYAREVLTRFTADAYRRPVDDPTIDRLTALAVGVYDQPGKTFETGVAQAMVAVLASPRFLFREEEVKPLTGGTYPLIDEYALASRLSYFLWSSMPDDELFHLAGEQKLRTNLIAQVGRMLADPRSQALVQNFTGQWLQARDIDTVPIDARSVLTREEPVDPEMERLRTRFRELRDIPEENLTAAQKAELAEVRAKFFKSFRPPRVDLDYEVRYAMRQQTEKVFEYVVQQNRDVLELVDCNYTFLNERLAGFYGMNGVKGDEMRLVTLPPDSPRGGVLGQGTVLVVTSNPTRTSAVKRGLFVLDNILGMPPPPPPPNIPPLEDAAKNVAGHEPSLRETLQIHRDKPLCSSCHSRMDPAGLALENFNAMGLWRTQERNQPIDVTGKLITGETFTNVLEFKRILATNHSRDFYRCLTEKLLTYALGRGLDYYDVETVDQIVEQLEKEHGHFSVLLTGIVESAPFQRCRTATTLTGTGTAKTVGQQAELKLTHENHE